MAMLRWPRSTCRPALDPVRGRGMRPHQTTGWPGPGRWPPNAARRSPPQLRTPGEAGRRGGGAAFTPVFVDAHDVARCPTGLAGQFAGAGQVKTNGFLSLSLSLWKKKNMV